MTEYMKNLRKYVGHMPLIQCGASVIVIDKDNRILLQKRRDNHEWAYAGGSVELGEAVEEAAKRELLEETGLTAVKLELFGVFSGPEVHYIYPNGDEVENIDTVFLCREYEGNLKPQPEEVDELKFFDLNDLPENISMPTWPALHKLKSQGCSPISSAL